MLSTNLNEVGYVFYLDISSMNFYPISKLGKTIEQKLVTSGTGLTLIITSVTIPKLPS